MQNEKIQQGMWMIGKWTFDIQDTITGKTRKIEEYNLIPTVAKEAFAAQMSNGNTTNIGDNLYVAIGSDPTAPASWDTTLGTEVTRKAASSTSFLVSVASVATFFAAWEATGTHREFWLFWNWNTSTASATPDTGILFSHVSANVSVSSVETLTTTFQISFTS